ncbi:PTS sugar transporter subunit IIB, partial [Streptococcus suis]|uniref:PTS sugar transporter subunit IIB n=1 Tax=Streptococcus suis TaxID=1307 RepID=UPI00137A6D8F
RSPDSVAMRFFSLQKVIDVIHKANPAQTIFLVIKDLQDALTLVKGGVPITELNIGNIHNAPGKTQVTRSIFFGSEDKAIVRELNDVYKIRFNTKT